MPVTRVEAKGLTPYKRAMLDRPDFQEALRYVFEEKIPFCRALNLKFRLDYDATERFSVGGNMLYSGSSYARGDESNSDVRGKVPGYTVVNLDSRYKVAKDVELFGRVNNLFDRAYANFGLLGRNRFAGPTQNFDPANSVAEQFRGYGAPRGIWVGARFSWL